MGARDAGPHVAATSSESMGPAQIERSSMAAIEFEMGAAAARFDARELAVVRRVIHATADFSFADTMTFSAGAMDSGLAALAAGACVVTDTNMALAGVSKPALAELGCTARCFMADPEVARVARESGTTRARASMDRASQIEGPLVVAVGNAPTALLRIAKLVERGDMRPDLVVGVPVGFVNVVESKERLLACGVPAIVARGRRGGSNVAAAIVNALLYLLARPGWDERGAEAPAGLPEGAPVPADPGEGLPRLPREGRAAVFAGTTEGRLLCGRLARAGRPVRAFVATDYGGRLAGEAPGVEVCEGRLDADAMGRAVAGCSLVVDATHPYARQVSENLRGACEKAGVPLLRVARPATPLPPDAVAVGSAREAGEFLVAREGEVLVATGAKELGVLAAAMGDQAARLHVRTLPSPEALRACGQAGVPPERVICVQGPVSRSMNVACLRDSRASWLLTKDSGREGGMPEKIGAARECGARLVVIGRPPEPEGALTFEQACRALGV